MLLVSQDSYQTPLRSCKNNPGVLGSISKREEPRETGAPYNKVSGSPGPNPPSERRRLELRLGRHLNVLSSRPSLSTCSAACVFITAVPIIKLSARGEKDSGGHVTSAYVVSFGHIVRVLIHCERRYSVSVFHLLLKTAAVQRLLNQVPINNIISQTRPPLGQNFPYCYINFPCKTR